MYEKMRCLIERIARDFQRRYGGELDEWIAEANLIFVKVVDRWDAKKGALTTWVSWKVWYGLLEIREKQWERESSWERNKHRLVGKSTFDLEKLLSEISEDSKTLVSLALSSPSDLLALCGKKRIRKLPDLVSLMCAFGWSVDRVMESVEEIREVL